MFRRRFYHLIASSLMLTLLPCVARSGSKEETEARALAGKIDALVEAHWREAGVKPAVAADDATFLRRVCLDLVGQVPSITEVRDFLDDPAPDKRARLVARLLASEGYAKHFANAWQRVLVPQDRGGGGPGNMNAWLQQQFRANVAYDQLARSVLTGEARNDGGGVTGFLQANEYKPENLAASVTRIFLGVKLECAQCHDHPFAKWKRQQFWETAAFFSLVSIPNQASPNRRGELAIPGTDKVVKARLLAGPTPVLDPNADPRIVLADWVASADNPYFARATANRLWAHFFGIGLVDPVEDFGGDHLPSHPELLDELARALADHKFDIRHLIRAITASRAYGLSSVTAEPDQDEPRLFARVAVRGLSAEQLFDSLAQVTGTVARPGNAAGFGPRADFLARFTGGDRPTEAATSILQALHLMNGKPMADATSLQGNKYLRTLAEAEGRTTAQKVEELYLLALARKPRADESARLVKFVEGGNPRRDSKKALADVFWVLLNSNEFCLNH